MGNCMSNCETDDLKLQTPIGSCSCLHSKCGCFGKSKCTRNDEKSSINLIAATKVEMDLIKHQISEVLEDAIKNNKKIPIFRVVTD